MQNRHRDLSLNPWMLALMIGLVTVVHLGAQAPSSNRAFDVASVKVNTSGDFAQRLQPSPGGRLTVTNISLRGMVRFAFEVQDFELEGGPDWFSNARFDVVAKGEGDPPLSEVRLMLRTLLADRFKLRTHHETREQPVYALVMARADRRLGPRLHKSGADCAPVAATMPIGPLASEQCGFFGPAPGVPILSGVLAFRGFTMDVLSRRIAPVVRRAVLDRTGLVGSYDGEFEAPAELPPPPPPPNSGIPNPFDPQNMPSIFAVFSEQLGLKLDPTRARVDILLVDHAELPTPD